MDIGIVEPSVNPNKQLAIIISKVCSRNLGRLGVLIYTLDFLNQSPDAARLYAALNILQTLLSSLNRGITTIGVSNNQKSEHKLGTTELTECTPYIALILTGLLGLTGIAISEGIVPFVIPEASEAPTRLSMRLYASVIPFWVAMMNVPSAYIGCSNDHSDLPILLREITSAIATNLVYFFGFKKYSPNSYIYALILHVVSGELFGLFFLKKLGNLNLLHLFQKFKHKCLSAYLVLRQGIVEGTLSGIDVVGWMLISWIISQKEDPRYLLNQLAQITFTSNMIDSLVTLFRKDPPTERLLFSSNSITLGIGIGISSLLSLWKGNDPIPGLYTLTLLPMIGKRIVSQLAMDRSNNPIPTNQLMVNVHLVITLLAIGFIFTAYFLDVDAEIIFLNYPLIAAGLGLLFSSYCLVMLPKDTPRELSRNSQEEKENGGVTLELANNQPRVSALGFFSNNNSLENNCAHHVLEINTTAPVI